MADWLQALFGSSMSSIVILAFVCVTVTLLGIVSAATQSRHKHKDKHTRKHNKTSRRRPALRGKHQFVHRPSLLDSGMAIFMPWRSDTPRSKVMQKSVFRGWYNLCWLIGGAYLLQYVATNWRNNGALIGNLKLLSSLFHYLHELLLVLLPIYALSFSAFFLQSLMARQIFGASYTRPILHGVQHVIQTVMIFGVGMFVFFYCEHWAFTQKFALIVETLCLYMKMHSYMLTNAELSESGRVVRQHKKKDDDDDDENDDDDTLTLNHVDDVDRLTEQQVLEELAVRGLRDFSSINMHSTTAANFCYYVNDDTQVNIYGFQSCYKNRSTRLFDLPAAASASITSLLTAANSKVHRLHAEIEKLKLIESSEMEKAFMRMVLKDAVFLERYRKTVYPSNVTLYNWIEFTFFPTLVYEPLYPRTASVRVLYVLEKIVIILFVMSFMYAILEQFILRKLSHLAIVSPVQAIIDLLVPATLMEICAFFVVFDCMLNCIAELTCFADRMFYQDWWNSTSFEEFARKWNRPVHEFLLRHVYYESMNSYKLSKNVALAGTFAFSIALHEVVLSACFHRFSPWLAFLSVMQLPLIPVMQSPAFKNTNFGNIVFWVGIIIGMPMACVLYAREYCVAYDCAAHIQ